MQKRGQGEMWWIIGIAIIVLIVIGISIYIFSDKISGFKKTTESCTFKSGTCKSSCAIDESVIQNTDCPTDKPNCCVGVFGK